MKKLALAIVVALALPASAAAKGPSKALIVGPGIAPIRISGAEGSATPFWRFVEATGWFEAAWGTSRLPQAAPTADLGPRYAITWAVPSSNSLHQDVYPYAKPYPVTYMPRGQEIYDTPVQGGWFTGGAKLEKALLRIGVPARPPPAPASSPSSLEAGGIAAAAALFALATSLPLRS
jgi:hypothetical protein